MSPKAAAIETQTGTLSSNTMRKLNLKERDDEQLFENAARGYLACCRLTACTTVRAQAPIKVPITDATLVATFHAEGAQIYECKPDTSNKPSEGHALSWQFREPIATLILDGKSIGRHYAGPNWDHIDRSGVQGKVVASALGATSSDIPWLRIEKSN